MFYHTKNPEKYIATKLDRNPFFIVVCIYIRDGFKKSKWKFKMAFAMKGGGGSEGVLSATYLF